MKNTRYANAATARDELGSRAFVPNPNEAIRDFFRRGDRGQYEGGPADLSLDSLPSLDLPERAPIIRTPKQRARRVAALWAEAVILVGCLAFMVTAATMHSNDGNSSQGNVNAAQVPPKQQVRSAPQASAAMTQPPKPVPSRVATDRTNTAALPPVKPVQIQMPRVSELAPAAPIAAAPAVTANPRKSTTRVEAPRLASPTVGPSRQVKPAPAAYQSDTTFANNSVAPKRAVAAFPED